MIVPDHLIRLALVPTLLSLNTELMAIDLPLEIWTEILSYLSLKSLLKTCQLNRQFLDSSLKFLYQEVYLACSDPDISHTFHSIIHDQLLAYRVRRIYISSQVSIPSDNLLQKKGFQQKFNHTLIRLDVIRRCFNHRVIPSSDLLEMVVDGAGFALLGPAPETLNLLLSNLRRLTITIDSRNHLNKLVIFLRQLWDNHRVGQSLRKLEIAASAICTVLLLLPIIRYPTTDGSSGLVCPDIPFAIVSGDDSKFRPCNITDLSLYFIPDSEGRGLNAAAFNRIFPILFKPLVSTLSSFSLSYTPGSRRSSLFDPTHTSHPDMSTVMEVLPYLPLVKELRFKAPFAPQTMKQLGSLTEWLRTYQGQLEELTIEGTTLEYDDSDDSDSEVQSADSDLTLSDGPGAMYSDWLVAESGFRSLTFPMLRSLEIRAGFMEDGTIIPPLQKVPPSLRSLTLGYDDELDLGEISCIMQNLPLRDCLKAFTLRSRLLTLPLLDFLHDKLPLLKALTVNCGKSMDSESIEELSKREYSWQLSNLMITSASQCRQTPRHFHPDLEVMRALAACLNCDPVLYKEFSCVCEDP